MKRALLSHSRIKTASYSSLSFSRNTAAMLSLSPSLSLSLSPPLSRVVLLHAAVHATCCCICLKFCNVVDFCVLEESSSALPAVGK
eukprot:SAG25_NODE_80_length_16705_cov_9.579746_17_plen_86_part_00